jgi:hypothetical protein
MLKFKYALGRLVLLFFVTFHVLFSRSSNLAVTVSASADQTYKLFAPYIVKGVSSTSIDVPKMLGIMPKGYWGTTTNDVNTMLKGIDSWSGKQHSLVGWFFDLREGGPDFNFKGQLENLWANGYTSFVNMGAGGLTSKDIAAHKYDAYIRGIANAYASWVDKGGGRRAFIAPLQEMNGYWTTYGKDPQSFKAAYDVIRQIFKDAGVSSSEVWWVFAPNGWAEEGHEFELYYPGDSKVDVVGFSSYNFGYCPVGDTRWRTWADFRSLYEPYVDRMRAMAPTKPIIIAQGATSAQYPKAGTYDRARKNAWIMDSYNYIANEPNVMALIYFDMNLEKDGECDYEVYNGNYRYEGYKTAVGNAEFKYYRPATLSGMDLTGEK